MAWLAARSPVQKLARRERNAAGTARVGSRHAKAHRCAAQIEQGVEAPPELMPQGRRKHIPRDDALTQQQLSQHAGTRSPGVRSHAVEQWARDETLTQQDFAESRDRQIGLDAFDQPLCQMYAVPTPRLHPAVLDQLERTAQPRSMQSAEEVTEGRRAQVARKLHPNPVTQRPSARATSRPAALDRFDKSRARRGLRGPPGSPS